MPFTMDDLDRVTIRVGMTDKKLRDLTDTQFTAWLRSVNAQGTINYSQPSPGQIDIPIEERIRILNELESSGFYIPGIMGSAAAAETTSGPDRTSVTHFKDALDRAAAQVDVARGLLQQVGKIDPSRVNLRQSLEGALALLEAARGAADRALRRDQG